MSDDIEELVRRYEEDVSSRHPRSNGLFPIPEYPELEAERGMWSAALDALLTTLRYLAPATLLTLFWGQQSFFFTLVKHIDNAFRAIVFSSEEQKKEVLQWLAAAGPMTVEHLDTVWRHGWILCSVLDGALPGACAGHPPTRLSLQHAQSIADHYLGVEPVFSRQEMESNDSLSRHQEWKLATYLDRIRIALSKITPAVSKPTSQRTSPETTQFTFDYVAKGSGLTVAQINHKMSFKVYPTSQQALEPGEVTILIKGPKNSYGMTVIAPILGKSQKIRQKLLGLHSKQTFTENALPITQGAMYLRAYGKNDMNKTYFIPKAKYDIEIEFEKRLDHAKIWYTVYREGKYEISITSRGLCVVGSPFMVTATENIFGILEKDNYCLEDGEEIDIVDVKNDRKVVLRIVDFVTEKMLLRENGTLEKISEAEAKILMTTDVENERSCSVTEIDDHNYKNKFNEVAQRILKMNRVCKVFNDLMENKRTKSAQKEKEKEREKPFICKRNQTDIPDIVNSTLCDIGINPFILAEDKYIVPENISVSIRTEKSPPADTEKKSIQAKPIKDIKSNEQVYIRSTSPDSLEEKLSEDEEEVSVNRLNNNNPFITSEASEDYEVEKKLGTFVKSEYETNNSQSEETRESTIKIIVDNNTPSTLENNPFIHTDVRLLDRPKTPVYKIITGELSNRADSPYLDPKNELLTDDMLSNEFINPFFMHHHQSTPHYDKKPTTDFIIGAPVSLPPILRAPSPEPDMTGVTCGIKANKDGDAQRVKNYENKSMEENCIHPSLSVFSTPLHTQIDKPKDQSALISSTFYSLDSDLTDTIDISNASTSSENQFEPYGIENPHPQRNRDFSPRKDLWDSAYVSIDDNNSSPDGNNNENNNISEVLGKNKFSHSDDTYKLREEELLNMGPAERELWTTCTALNETNKIHDEVKPYRWEIKRPMFTPIIEESDRSISSGIKEISLKSNETDSVTVAFAEINDIYQEYFPNSEICFSEDNLHRTEEQTIETDDTGVESASETLSDVIRHEIGQKGKISEVQANATESVSASQTLYETNEQLHIQSNADAMQFGDITYNNIVLEKKKYWDEKIRQIEAKTEESTKHLKKKRIPAKQLKHDSLSKRKGKQIIKNFLHAGEQLAKQTKQNNLSNSEEVESSISEEIQLRAEEKLVDKWRKFWDEKLESEHENIQNTLPVQQSAIHTTATPENTYRSSDRNLNLRCSLPVKQELPEEEVFKAFETSPKRFFGTSRKRILNKIDTFLGIPVSVTENAIIEQNKISPDSGLVSSRISLFHSMSNAEPLPETRNKSDSLHNIFIGKNNYNAITSVEKSYIEEIKSKRQNNVTENQVSKVIETEKDSIAVAVKSKRNRLTQISFNTSFDEVDNNKLNERTYSSNKQILHKTKREYRTSDCEKYKKSPVALRRTSISKSEMDIFNKVPIEQDDGLDKHKSYDDLPKINVKSFISLYENVSKNSVEQKPLKRIYRPSSVDSETISPPISLTSNAEKESISSQNKIQTKSMISPTNTPETAPKKQTQQFRSRLTSENTSTETDNESLEIEERSQNKETTYVSLSDIELEIVESSTDKSSASSPERTGQPHIDYQNRFKQAKQYFQSLEELREIKKPKKLNECQLLLLNKSTESLENERPQKRVKKKIKSHSMPSSEIAKYWNEMQKNEKQTETKLVKISEKFHVDDLFSDVMEGKLSRQGSLRGIPHKKAVLEAFRSMENISDDKISAYEMSSFHVTDFTSGNRVTSAQTYLNEYPYLPTTDPSNYHSRLDAKASGLITLKELLGKKRRRNSVPDLRLLPKFSAEL